MASTATERGLPEETPPQVPSAWEIERCRDAEVEDLLVAVSLPPERLLGALGVLAPLRITGFVLQRAECAAHHGAYTFPWDEAVGAGVDMWRDLLTILPHGAGWVPTASSYQDPRANGPAISARIASLLGMEPGSAICTVATALLMQRDAIETFVAQLGPQSTPGRVAPSGPENSDQALLGRGALSR